MLLLAATVLFFGSIAVLVNGLAAALLGAAGRKPMGSALIGRERTAVS